MQPVDILSDTAYHVDPYNNDFYKEIIELRTHTKQRRDAATETERDDLDIQQGALKILANATSYGIFLQLNVTEVADPKVVNCYTSSGTAYPVEMHNVEKPGEYFHPLLGTFITGAARLMLAISERLALDHGLGWVFCDTDSMAFAKPESMTQSLFHERVDILRNWFRPLNPYSTQQDMFKLEDTNFGIGSQNKTLASLYCLAVSAKRYVMFNLDANQQPIIRKGSAHGLGHLFPPYGDDNPCSDMPLPAFSLSKLLDETGLTLWQHDLWYTIVTNALAGRGTANPASDKIYNQPSARRYTVTTPELERWFKHFNTSKLHRTGQTLQFHAGIQSQPQPKA